MLVDDQSHHLLTNAPGLLDMSASYALRESYRNLENEKDLRTIRDPSQKPDQLSFAISLGLKLKPDIDLLLDGSTEEGTALEYAELRIKRYIHYIFRLWDPKQVLKIYTTIASRYLKFSSPQATTSCLEITTDYLSTIHSTEICTPCKTSLTDLIQQLTYSYTKTMHTITITNTNTPALTFTSTYTINKALTIIINEINLFVSGTNHHPDLGRRVFFDMFLGSMRQILDVDVDAVVEYIVSWRGRGIRELHAWRPDIFRVFEYKCCGDWLIMGVFWGGFVGGT